MKGLILIIFCLVAFSLAKRPRANPEAMAMMSNSYDAKVYCQVTCKSVPSPRCVSECFVNQVHCRSQCHGSTNPTCVEECVLAARKKKK